MTNREVFIDEVENLLFEQHKTFGAEAQEFWEQFKADIDASPAITENGIKILTYMKENKESFSNSFKAKDIGDGLGVSGRSVAGSMKKLVADGFCNKTTTNPVFYSLTDKGHEVA